MFLDTPNVEKVKSGFELLPKGMYRAMITKAEEKSTQDGTGSYIAVTFDVIEGDFKGRKLWHNFTRRNKSDIAVKIGQSDLKKLVEACGWSRAVASEAEFHKIIMDRVLWLDVGVRKDKKTGEERQQIYDFLADKPSDEATSTENGVPPPTDLDIPF